MKVFTGVTARKHATAKFAFSCCTLALMMSGGTAFAAHSTDSPADKAQTVDTATPAPAEKATAQAEPLTGSTGGDIIVTANRREQSLQNVGLSVTVLSGNDLTTKGITTTADLARTVPSFSAADSSLNTPIYSIRGIGLNESSIGANSTIAISVDQVPLAYAAMTPGAVLDLQRVEVLKGPQGTLYGLNATGGAINYIAARPTDKLEAGATASLGRFATFTGEAHISGPLTDTLGIRIAANTVQAGDWQRSYTRDAELGEIHRGSARLILAWKPTPGIRADLVLNGWLNTSDAAASQAIAFRVQSPANIGIIANVLAQPLAPADARAANWDPGHDYARDDKFYQGSLKLGVDLADHLTFESISALSHFQQRDYIDRDGLPVTNYHVQLRGYIDSFYEEGRFIYNSGNLNLSGGANYRNDVIDDDQTTETVASSISIAAGRPIPYNGIDTHQKVSTYAFFADGEYKLTNRLSIVAGIRYTRDIRNFRGSTIDTGDGLSAAAFTVVMNAQRARFGLPALSAIPVGGSVTLAPGTFAPGYVTSRLDQNNLAFHGGLNFKPTTDTLLYASYSRGFKAGSFPTLGAIFAVGFDPAVQERVDAYEAGFKLSLFDRVLRLNGAAFYYDYKNKQFRGRIIDPVLGSLSKLVNIPRSEVYGAELDAVLRPVQGLTVTGAVTYIHSKVLDFTNVNLFGVLENFRGSRLNYTPDWSVNLSPEYKGALNDSLNYILGADMIYRSSTSGFLGNDRDLFVKAYTTVDLHAGIADAHDRWSATIYGNNVTNEYYWTSVNRGSDTIFRYAAMPVTYGIRVSLRY